MAAGKAYRNDDGEILYKFEYTSEIIRKRGWYSENRDVYFFNDLKGVLFKVEIHKGKVYRVDGRTKNNPEPKFIEQAIEGKSKKRNGYLYIWFYHNENGANKRIDIAKHQLIAFLNNPDAYWDLIASGVEYKDIVVCHKNGLPWDDRDCNLEFGTTAQNLKQSQVALLIHKAFEKADVKYAEYVRHVNKDAGEKYFLHIYQGIENKWIEEYEKNKVDIINNLDAARRFVNWLFEKGYWKK